MGIMTLGLGFQSRDESMDFKMFLGEFARQKDNAEEAKLQFGVETEDFSLAADEVLVMKPMNKRKKNNKQKEQGAEEDLEGGGLFLPPPSEGNEGKGKGKGKKKKKDKKSKKKKKKKQQNADVDADFGDFG